VLVQLGYFYTLYDSTEISQVDTRNAGEYGKEAEKANEDRPQSLRSLPDFTNKYSLSLSLAYVGV
jgi:hypothetical protein